MKFNIELLKYLLLILLGIYSFFLPTSYLKTFHLISYVGILGLGIYFFIKNIKNHKLDLQSILSIIISIILFIVIKKFPNIYLNILPITIGLYILIIGIAKLMSLFIYKELPESKIFLIISTFLHLSFAFLFILFPKRSLESCTILAGLYLISNGIEKIYNHYSNKYSYITKAPSILLSIKPYRTLLKLKGRKFTNTNDLSDIEVLIHVRRTRRGIFGHADLVYKGFVYSYGNYDNSTYKIFDAIGEGVLFKTERNKYIEFCKSYGKTLFCFGLKLNEIEARELDERFNKIMDNTHIWDKKNITNNTYGDQLNKNLDITFYKFNEGYYQNYFFLNYNCVKYIEEVISPQLFDFTTIKTPGILYSYLENERTKKDSKIKYKNIY